MEKEFYVAAMEGNVDFLEEIKSDEYLLGKTTQKNNVLHIAVQCEKIEFIEAVLRRLVPNKREVLLCEKNSKGNTPLHIAVETGNIDVVKILYDHHLLDAKTVAGDAEKPWMRIQNLEGNTAAHVAIIHDNLEIAMFLLEKDTGLACIVNESKEAPLHLALKNPASYSEKNSVQARIQRQLDLTKPITSLVPEEDTISIIKILVEQAGRVTCWRDANGFTPLHRAASLTSPYNLQITTFIIQQWPQSAEVRDNSGKSILHLLVNRMPSYREVKKLVNRKELYKLRNCQDHQGNTPLHIAALNMDIIMVRALLESRANPRIINMEGFDATSLIQQQNIIEKLKTQSMTEEECEAGERGDITFLKERLSYFGVDFLRSQDSNGQNLLHKLFKLPIDTRLLIGEEVKDEYYDFIKQVMSSYPALVCQTDLNGDTPIHVLVRHNDIPGARSLIARRLELCNKFIKEMEEEAARNNEAPYDPPWVVQNADGNTPMHQALMGSFWFDTNKVIMKLMEYNERPIELMCNKRGETLYHLVKFNRKGWPPEDEDGFTPLMRAIQDGPEDTAMQLLNDKSYWWSGRDKKGNASYHLAIQHYRFQLFSKMLDLMEKGDDIDIDSMNTCVNKANETTSDLIGELDSVPDYLEKQILKNPELRGIRSAWSIPKSQLQNYMSSVNVIAALLTTITFTAAFTVPGGLDQEEGTPLLLAKSIAFQVFIISDVIAMCLSMMVLFCLLWIVATDKRNSVMIQDFAITLLLASFVATLLTFMAGVYATTSSIKPWIAIATLVLCSLLMLLVHKFVLTNLVIPFKIFIKHPIYSVKLLFEKIADMLYEYY